MVFPVLKEILRIVFLNYLLMKFVCRPTYVNLAYFVFVLTFRVCVSFAHVILFKIFTSYLFVCNICFIVSYYFLLFLSSIRYVERRLIRYLIDASFCSGGWQESLGMMSVAVVFLNM
jgi:hypothetical protein